VSSSIKMWVFASLLHILSQFESKYVWISLQDGGNKAAMCFTSSWGEGCRFPLFSRANLPEKRQHVTTWSLSARAVKKHSNTAYCPFEELFNYCTRKLINAWYKVSKPYLVIVLTTGGFNSLLHIIPTFVLSLVCGSDKTVVPIKAENIAKPSYI